MMNYKTGFLTFGLMASISNLAVASDDFSDAPKATYNTGFAYVDATPGFLGWQRVNDMAQKYELTLREEIHQQSSRMLLQDISSELSKFKYHHQRWWYDNVKRSKRLFSLLRQVQG